MCKRKMSKEVIFSLKMCKILCFYRKNALFLYFFVKKFGVYEKFFVSLQAELRTHMRNACFVRAKNIVENKKLSTII